MHTSSQTTSLTTSPTTSLDPVGSSWARRLPIAGLAVVALVASACGDDAAADGADAVDAVPTVTVTAYDFGFEVPDMPAGPVRLDLVNTGEQLHHAQLMRYRDGVTDEDVTAALATSEAALLEVTDFVAGTGAIDPGTTSEADGLPVLAEGRYAFLCFFPDMADGVPHFAKGMQATFDVVGEAATDVASPDPVGAIQMVDYGFELPAEELAAGTYQVSNDGTEAHEMNVIRLGEGGDMSDVIEFLEAPAGPPSFQSVGGQQALMPGDSGRVMLDLPAGEYVFLCYIPSADGVSHFAKGMIRQVTVTG